LIPHPYLSDGAILAKNIIHLIRGEFVREVSNIEGSIDFGGKTTTTDVR